MEQLETEAPYCVDIEDKDTACDKCGHGILYIVVYKPTDTAEGISFEYMDDANALCEMLNSAHRRGQNDK